MFLIIAVAAAVCGLDLFTKKRVVDLDDRKKLPEKKFGVHVKRVENPGLLMGWMKEYPLVVKTLPIAALALYMLLMLPRGLKGSIIPKIGWGLLIGGSAGNMIEHIVKGRVIDFIRQPDIPKKERKSWFYYNIGDIGIVLGAIMTLFR